MHSLSDKAPKKQHKYNMEIEEIAQREKPMFGATFKYVSTFRAPNKHHYVTFICSKHGEQTQRLDQHLKNGCKWCKMMDSKRKNYHLAYGVGINDVANVWTTNNKAFSLWRSMLSRCYSEFYQRREPSYIGCTVCDEWLVLSNFIKLFDENYIEGFELDKDIIKKGNNVYCPEYCTFVPREINSLILRRQKWRGKYPIGVYFDKRKNKFRASLNYKNKTFFIGHFDNEKYAFYAYKKEKEKLIKEVAVKFKNIITKEAYEALLKYEIEITD